MKKITCMVVLLMVALTGYAMAECSGNRIGEVAGKLEALLTGKLVNGFETGGSDTWQEVHCTNSKLFELAKGAEDPVDPSHVVGTWTIEDRGAASGVDEVVCYIYSGGGKYCFRIYENSGSYTFCDEDGIEKATADIVVSPVTCP